MGEDGKPIQPLEGQSLEDLEKQVRGGVGEGFDMENEEDRITHSDSTLDSFATVSNIGFERILFGAGIGLFVVLFILAFTFYSTLESETQTREDSALVITQADKFYEDLLEDKNYVFIYEDGSEVKSYDPLNTDVNEDADSSKLTSSTARLTGNFTVTNGGSRVVDPQGATVMEIKDPAIEIDKLISMPSGASFVFDVEPATRQAEEAFGLRTGAYEYNIEEEKVYTLVSDASPGSGTPGYRDHYVNILTISPHGRYLSYTNDSKLWLYDRLSNASLEIAELANALVLPDTGWQLRPLSTEVESLQTTTER